MPLARERFIEKIPLNQWAHLHAHLIWSYDGPVDANGHDGLHEAPHLTAWLLREGHVELRVRDIRLHAQAGEWLFPPPGKVWRRFSEDARILSVRYRASWPSGEDLFSDGLGVSLKAKDYPELEHAALPLCGFVKQQFPEPTLDLLRELATLESALRLQRLFAAWLEASVCALVRAGLVPARMGHIDERLLKAVWLLERHALSEPFTEAVLSEQVGLSITQLNRLFRYQFGMSSHSYYERRRREQAIAALQGSAHTVKEIAYLLGFSSLPHFSAWVKQQLGQSPREFRKNQEQVP